MKKAFIPNISILIIALLCALVTVRGPILETVLILTIVIWAFVTALAYFGPRAYYKCKELYALMKSKENQKKQTLHKNKLLLPEDACFRFMKQLITLQLRKYYPDARWEWDVQPSKNVLFQGGTCRVKLANAGEFNYAELSVDRQLVKIEKFLSVTSPKNIKECNAEDSPPNEYMFDFQLWHDQIAFPLVDQILSDLLPQGYNQVIIDKSGAILSKGIEAEEEIGQVPNFPEQRHWGKIAQMFQKDGLIANIMADRMYLTRE